MGSLPGIVNNRYSQFGPFRVVNICFVYMFFDFSGIGVVAGSQVNGSAWYCSVDAGVVLAITTRYRHPAWVERFEPTQNIDQLCVIWAGQ